MSKSALLNMLGDSRRKTIMHEQDGKRFIETRQDVSHIIEAAKIMSDEVPGKEFRHMAYIPETVLNQAMTDGWLHDKVAWKRWLNDPANECYRTWKGRA